MDLRSGAKRAVSFILFKSSSTDKGSLLDSLAACKTFAMLPLGFDRDGGAYGVTGGKFTLGVGSPELSR